MNNIALAFALAIFTAIMDIDWWSELGIGCPLVFGIVTGIIVGDIQLGFQIGSLCTLMSLGFHSFGGATIPDYRIGSLFAVVAAKETGNADVGLLIGTTIGLLMMQLNVLGRTLNTVWLHRADQSLKNGSISKFEFWHRMGLVTWMILDSIPVFIGVLFKDNLSIISNFANQWQWVSNGLKTVGILLPAVGFAMLLSYLDVKRFWPFLILGYLLFAYMGMPIIGLAIAGSVAAGLDSMYGDRISNSQQSNNNDAAMDGEGNGYED